MSSREPSADPIKEYKNLVSVLTGSNDAMDVPEALSCAICMDLPLNPTRWPAPQGSSCTHSYCRECVIQCLNRPSPDGICCPLCRTPAAEHGSREFRTDGEVISRLEKEAGPQYALRVAAAEAANQLYETLPKLPLYSMKQRYRFANKTITLPIRDPKYLWFVVRLLQTGQRRFGLLFGAEQAGTEGRVAVATNLYTKEIHGMDLGRAMGKVTWQLRTRGNFDLKVRITDEHFTAISVERDEINELDEDSWRSLGPPGVELMLVDRFVSARVVTAPDLERLPAALAAAAACIPNRRAVGGSLTSKQCLVA